MLEIEYNRFQTLSELKSKVLKCRLCPRLNQWRQNVSRNKVSRFQNWEYWGKPVPSLGETEARLLVVGLAPAAHGANRTGRMFTGDRSGDWLYQGLHQFRFANQPQSSKMNDGLKLIDCYITAIIHCAPPSNKPTRQEIDNCHSYLDFELNNLKNVKIILALGQLAFENTWKILIKNTKVKRPKFQHGLEVSIHNDRTLIASFHPSQQNTFTGKLTKPMFNSVLARARKLIDDSRRTSLK
jgi:uracil-DNA glycosylase family 4